MHPYRAPLSDIAFLLKHVFPLDRHTRECGIDFDVEIALAIADEAGKFAGDVIAPLNRPADVAGARWSATGVETSKGFEEAYRAFCEGGWNGLRFPEQYGGQGLCAVISTLVDEMWHAASFSFALCPMLTSGAAEALLTAGSDELKNTYLNRLVSGEWTGTMNLTEPGAGSDLAAVQTRAERQPDGTYRITGQKIFITYGEHDLADNIVHLVLARTPDAPRGVKGISLFVVPKFLLDEDGRPARRNDVRCASIEHKLGIHGSPTAVMLFGEAGGAVGYLVGEENRGLEYMFIMMNEARFAVGLQGLAISERAYQHALSYAFERVQGRAVGEDGSAGNTIVCHPDVRRMLQGMKSRILAMRALAVYVAMQKDLSHSPAVDADTQARARQRMELLVPVVKGWLTETAQAVTYDALQVFGGMGYIEETGVAQYTRDARITTIYEGTTAIQANDLVGRKTQRDRGAAALALLAEMRKDAHELRSLDSAAAARLSDLLLQACDALHKVVQWIVSRESEAMRDVYAGSVPYLMLWGCVSGGWMHALRLRSAVAASAQHAAAAAPVAAFYADHTLICAPALAETVMQGATGALTMPDDAW